jgi:uncharacterized repeat protein (TIGR01451 family)
MSSKQFPAGGRILSFALLAGLLGTSLSGQSGSPTIELISVTTGGAAGGGQVYLDETTYDRGGPSHISADNRYVVFVSASDQLVAGDVNNRPDVFLRDRQTGITTIVSRASDGSQANDYSGTPVISADGRYVAFVSWASNLAPLSSYNNSFAVFVRDLQAGTTELASVSTNGAVANYGAFGPAISADGRYVAFASASDTLVPGDTNVYNYDIFVRDRVMGTTERVSLRPDGSQIVGSDSESPSISADGRRVAFVVWDNTLGGPTPQVPPNLHHGVYVRDLDTNETILVSARPDGTPSDRLVSLNPAISANGRYVSFTNWEDLDPAFPDSHLEPDGPYADVFVRDLQTNITTRVSLPFTGGPAEESGGNATISADGRYVAYISRDNGLRVRDRLTGTTTNVTAPGGVPPDGYHQWPSISQDGQLVLFESFATNLVANDANGVVDSFLYIAPPIADLSLALQASSLQPSLNDDVTFTVTVTNHGPRDVTDVAVRVALPAGVIYVSDTGGGHYASGAGIWTVGALASGASASLQIVGHFTAASTVSVTAQVSASSLPDPDSTPDNNSPAEDDQQTVLLTPSLADLSLALAANTTSPAINSNVTFTITLTNGGPASATGVAVRMPLPAGLTFVSAMPAAAYDAATGVWTLGAIPVGATLPAGATIALQVVARATGAGAIDVTAQVSTSNRPDPDSIPNNTNPAEDDQQTIRLTPVVTGIVVNHPGAQINPNDGFCTLREAIRAANTDTPSGVPLGECAAGNGPDVIHMRATPPVYTHAVVDNSVYGPTALPVVSTAIIIEGNGATIERSSAAGTPDLQLFAVAPGASLTLRDATVRGARSNTACGGGFVLVGAAAALVRTTISNNSAAYGGGICAIDSVLTLTDSSVSGNSALTTPASVMAIGGGIYVARGSAVLTNTTISGNVANATQRAFGGGIWAYQVARLSLVDSRVENNSAVQSGTPAARYAGGGGIWAESPAGAPTTTVELTRTTVIGNSVVGGNVAGWIGSGGGLRLWNATTMLVNSTIQGNSAASAGGIAVLQGGTLSMTGGAINANVASGAWTIGGGGGMATDPATSAALIGVLVSNNQAPGGGNGGGIFNRGKFTMIGGGLRNNTAQSGGGLSNGTSSMTGGPVALTNVAIEGNVAASYGGGIFNANPPGIPTTAVITIGGGRIQSNRALGGGGIFTRSNSIVRIDGNAVVSGNVAADTGGGIENYGSLDLTGSTVSDNIALLAAGIGNFGSATLTGSIVSGNSTTLFGGGGLGNWGRLTLANSTVSGNTAGSAGNGGGIEQYGGATLTLDNSTLSGNTSGQGGGGLAMIFGASSATIRNNSVVADNVTNGLEGGGGILANSGTTVSLSDSIVRGNRTAASGGGISSKASVTILRSTVSENSAGLLGGGVRVDQAGSSLTLRESRVRSNRTTVDGLSWGGGLFVGYGAAGSVIDSHIEGNASDFGAGLALFASGLVTLERVAITGNVAARLGGGVLADAGSRFQMRASTVSGNRATLRGGGVFLINRSFFLDALGTFAYVTISGNDAQQGGGLYDGGGTPTTLTASIVAGNLQAGNLLGASADCFGSVSGGGTNLVGIGTGCPVAGNKAISPADVFATALGPLSDNGGPSPTHALLPGSPAMDVTGLFTCVAPVNRLDQRGVTRPRDGNGDGIARCDIGAFER